MALKLDVNGNLSVSDVTTETSLTNKGPGFSNTGGLTIRNGYSSFDPTTISGLVQWVKADNLASITKTGTNVTAWNDLSGSANHYTTRNGTPQYIANGQNGLPCIRFTRAGPDLMVTGVGALNLSATNCTVIYACKATTQTYRVLAGKNNNWLLGYHDGLMGRFYFEGWNSGNNGENLGNDYRPHVWGAMITTGASGSARCFMDNIECVSSNAGKTGPDGLTINAHAAALSGSGSEQSDCDVYEILVYNRVLSLSEYESIQKYLEKKWILDLRFEENPLSDTSLEAWWKLDGDLTDATGNGHTLTNSNVTWGYPGVNFKQAAVFNGTSSRLKSDVGTAFNTTDFTLACWAYAADWNKDMFLMEHGDVNTSYSMFQASDTGYGIGATAGSGKAHTICRLKPSGVAYGDLDFYGDNKTFGTNTWHHFAHTNTGGVSKFYIDGKLVASKTLGSPASLASASYIVLGAYGGTTPGYYFAGRMCDARVYKRALSQREIARVMNYVPYTRASYFTGTTVAKIDQNGKMTIKGSLTEV